MSDEIPYSYDRVPYESQPFPQSHPDRLATLGTLFGMTPQPIDRCRVLELGCASGGNLIPIAHALPNSRFVGVELSARQAADGRALMASLGLKNIEVQHLSIMDVTLDFGRFDYIIAHGVYSWVPDEVQDKILEICRDNLTPNGVAYISYNTYPGWHYRGMIRDMMLYHTKQFTEPQMRATQARALLDFLAQSVPTKDNAYGIMLKNELDLLRLHRDYYLLHDHLEEANLPIYFHEFCERAGRHDLQYLGEAEFSTMLAGNFPKEVSDTLRRVSNEIVRTEQYMDFLRNRTFRQTLLCRKEVVLTRNLGPPNVMRLRIASAAKAVSEQMDLRSTRPEEFRFPNGRTFTIAGPLVKAAFQYLAEIWPQSVTFDDLLNTARSRLAPVLIQGGETHARQAQTLGADILTSYTANLVELHVHKADFATHVSDRPMADALAREQARTDGRVTNRRHEAITLDEFNRHVLRLLDGTRNREGILDGLAVLVADGTLVVQQEGKQIKEGESLKKILAEALDKSLQTMAKAALLVG